MSAADFVQPISLALVWTCRAVLTFYVCRVGLVVLRGNHRLREALALAYTLFAASVIFLAIGAIDRFTQSVSQGINVLAQPSPGFRVLIALYSACVFSSFICNFSRSLWML